MSLIPIPPGPRSNGRATNEFKSKPCGPRYAFCKLIQRFSLFLCSLFTPSLPPRLSPELLFLVAKFLESSPCHEAAQVDKKLTPKVVQKALILCAEQRQRRSLTQPSFYVFSQVLKKELYHHEVCTHLYLLRISCMEYYRCRKDL